MNETQITVVGWVGGAVTLREVSGGRQVATFRVATTPRRWRDGEWVAGPTTWHTVKAWNRLALHAAESLASGDPVVVHGRLTVDVWEREGRSMTSYEVVADAVGHDLNRGTSTFTRHAPPQEPPVPATAESGPAQVPAVEPVDDADGSQAA